MSADPFSLPALVSALGLVACRFDVEVLAECDSTNTQLLSRAQQGAPSGSVVLAERQTAGRGRRGRAWVSAPGDSLTFSLLWRFPENSSAPVGLSLVVGLALVRGLTALGAGLATLKWPNDLLWQGKKLAGILVELSPGSLQSAVIGVGLNLRLPAALPAEVVAQATDLQAGLSPLPSRETVLAALLQALQVTLDEYAVVGFAGLREAWQQHHAWQGLPVRVSGGEDAEGRCLGVDAEGALQLETPSGLRTIRVGDVSLRPGGAA